MVSMTTGTPLGVLELDGRPLSLEQINLIANSSMNAAIASAARPRIAASQAVVERIVTSNETAYGINTGFGKLSDVRISTGDLHSDAGSVGRTRCPGHGDPGCGLALPLVVVGEDADFERRRKRRCEPFDDAIHPRRDVE